CFANRDGVIQHKDFGMNRSTGFVRNKRRCTAPRPAVSAVFDREWRWRGDSHRDLRREFRSRITDERTKCKDTDCLLRMAALGIRWRRLEASPIGLAVADRLQHGV